MSTYGCGNVTQDDAAIGGGGGSGFGLPSMEKNESQPPNTNNNGAKASGTFFLGRVVNTATTRIGGPALGGLVPVNPGLIMDVAGLQAPGHGSVVAVTLISALTNNMGVPTTLHRRRWLHRPA